MSKKTLKVRVSHELLEDLRLFHGLNAVRELHEVAKQQAAIEGAEGYSFELGEHVAGEWVTEKELTDEDVNELEALIDSIPYNPNAIQRKTKEGE